MYYPAQRRLRPEKASDRLLSIVGRVGRAHQLQVWKGEAWNIGISNLVDTHTHHPRNVTQDDVEAASRVENRMDVSSVTEGLNIAGVIR